MSRTHRILVTDGVDAEGVAVLRAVPSFVVEESPTLPPAKLAERIGEFDAIVGRSATRISADLLRAATRLRVVGRAGVGVDNVAIDAATELGVAVINAPAGNTVAVAELLFGCLLGLLRRIPQATTSLHDGRWERSQLMGTELKGRRLGIVGLGRIGGEVAVRAHAFGVELLGYDPYVAAERFAALRVRRLASLDELLPLSDILTVHTPLTEETTGLVGAGELARLPRGAIVANLARGGIVDEAALVAALRSGQLAGAAVDAFTAEPLTGDHLFRGVPNLLLTPHIGANTLEAQRNVAVDVCEAVRDALLDNELSRSLNVSSGDAGGWRELQPALQLMERAAAVARACLAERGARAVTRLAIRMGRELQGSGSVLLAAAAMGVLENVVESGRVNVINARAIAAARGVQLSVGEASPGLAPHAVEVEVGAGETALTVAGTAAPGSVPRLTQIGGFHVDVNPKQTLLILTNRDVPGVIGRVGTLLGDAGVNIAEYHQARLAQGGEALAAVSVDGVVDDATRARLLQIPEILTVAVVRFRAS